MEKEPIPKFKLEKGEVEKEIRPKEMEEIVEMSKEDKELEECPEKWAKEIPEALGTTEERKENYERFLTEFEKVRKKEGILREEFQLRLERARKIVENKLFYHVTSLRRALKIFQLEKILSVREMIEEKKEVKESLNEEEEQGAFTTHTYENDRKLGLDDFAFVSADPLPYGEAILCIGNKILEKPDCIVTGEDVSDTLDRMQDIVSVLPGISILGAYAKKEMNTSDLSEIINEYKKLAISGKDFKEFYSHYLATYFENPSEVIGFSTSIEFESEKAKHLRKGRGKKMRTPFFLKDWCCPEIKVKKQIGIEDIKAVLVKSKKEANFLASRGVPENLIWIGEEHTNTQNEDWKIKFEKEKLNKLT